MGRMVMIAGAGDAAGLRLAKDFLKAGDTVIAGLLTGQDAAALPEGMESVTIDPLSDSSAKRAAAEVAKKHPGIDLLVVNYDCCTKPETWTILDAPDYAAMKAAYDYNTLGPLRAIEAFLPLLEAGQGRRICCVTTVQSSNNAARDCADYPAHVSKAPLNMAMNPAVQRPAPERIHLPDVLQGSRSRAGKGGRIRSGILYPQPQQRAGILQAFRREPPCAARLDEH